MAFLPVDSVRLPWSLCAPRRGLWISSVRGCSSPYSLCLLSFHHHSGLPTRCYGALVLSIICSQPPVSLRSFFPFSLFLSLTLSLSLPPSLSSFSFFLSFFFPPNSLTLFHLEFFIYVPLLWCVRLGCLSRVGFTPCYFLRFLSLPVGSLTLGISVGYRDRKSVV